MKQFFRGEQVEAYAAEIREKTGKLKDFIRSVATSYRGDYKLPLGDDGRLVTSSYENAETATQGLRRWHGDVADKTVVEKDSERDSERLEMLAYAILYKNLRERFIVARASYHDGSINKVHTILLERETGTLVCAFDEVADTSGPDYEKKQDAVRSRNINRGGASLRDGLRIEERDGNKIISKGAVENIPLFYIALPTDRVERGIQRFIPSLDAQSEFERQLFKYFISAILIQIQGLELYTEQLDPALKKKLGEFKKTIAEFS